MSTHRSDEEALAHDAADEFLNTILEDADVDLHAAIAKVVNLDVGLAAIIGSDRVVPTSTSGRPNAHTPSRVKSNVRATSRSLLFQWWTNVLLAVGVLRHAFTKIFDFSTHDFLISVHIESSASRRESLAEVCHQIDILATSLTEIYRLANNLEQRQVTVFCVRRLGSFRKALENGEVTRDEAEEVVADVQQRLQATFRARPVSLTSYVTYLTATGAGAFSLLVSFWHITRINSSALLLGGLSIFCSLVISIYFHLSSEGRLAQKRVSFTKIDSDLAGLKRVVHRLFDDADDLDFDRSGLPR
jgi:hypothetical protein